jgi:ADP-heptose:LPS heptosyltransferase
MLGYTNPQSSATKAEPHALGRAPRILVIKLATPGDALLATPALRALRLRYPEAEIDLLTTEVSAALLRESPLVNHIYTLDKYTFDTPAQIARRPWRVLAAAPLLVRLRARRYAAAVLMHHLTLRFGTLKYRLLLAAVGARLSIGLDNGNGRFLDVCVADEGFGARHEAEYGVALAAAVDATVPPGEGELRLADLGWTVDEQPRRPSADVGHTIALHPGSGAYSPARRWPVERFAALGQALHDETGAEIVLVGAADERALCDEVLDRMGRPSWARNEAGMTSPKALSALLGRCALFVGNDSFPMHLAAAVGTPVVAVFGPSNAAAWAPYVPAHSERAVVVRRMDLNCSPCIYRGHLLGTPQGCPERPCLTELGIQPVLAAARRLLDPRAASGARGG